MRASPSSLRVDRGRASFVADPRERHHDGCRSFAAVPGGLPRPGDDYLVALARAARVDALVTGDRDLLELEDAGVAVITPRELIERLVDVP
jgi:hypothetical protein